MVNQTIDGFKDTNGEITLENLKKIIPYKEPFIFVDKVVSLTESQVIAEKKVSKDEPALAGHFVDFPIMPGALLVEGLGQTGTLLVRYNLENHETKDVLAYKIKEVEFKHPVFPGMTIRYEIAKLFCDERGAILRGKIFSKEIYIAQALFVLAIVDKQEFRGKYTCT